MKSCEDLLAEDLAHFLGCCGDWEEELVFGGFSGGFVGMLGSVASTTTQNRSFLATQFPHCNPARAKR